ncbi:hypothetical protein Lqua_2832 [Legionella quateirensis]|uniref:Uncharacterized protein n=2 Tax=Legionella quateirensis TaxID=45072 RepID=A0ABR5RP80_9GAMM|nr:hypothetical protein Lqua_2832 [Legionella quateirensis]
MRQDYPLDLPLVVLGKCNFSKGFIQKITGVYMINRLKGVLILSLPVLALNANSNNTFESKDILTQKCRDLAQTVASLVSSQEKRACAEKLAMASMQIDIAGDWLIEDVYSAAKKELDNAVYSLQYAELNNCNRYIQISHSKFEAQRIKNSL